ncbi:SUMF1/EgtB/PvdO family nonheme iron enzyme [Paenibacillus sp. LjRoot56]|uniref:SUMF1/EgtB/PvdO family nonheme iron enzyme n=1 Tax=Paenibacillus sp. LjRoot56 TaxID=3342333 RepID=UPI003F50C023
MSVNPFYIDATTLTNEEFKRFVEDTGFQTKAERFGPTNTMVVGGKWCRLASSRRSGFWDPR